MIDTRTKGRRSRNKGPIPLPNLIMKGSSKLPDGKSNEMLVDDDWFFNLVKEVRHYEGKPEEEIKVEESESLESLEDARKIPVKGVFATPETTQRSLDEDWYARFGEQIREMERNVDQTVITPARSRSTNVSMEQQGLLRLLETARKIDTLRRLN